MKQRVSAFVAVAVTAIAVMASPGAAMLTCPDGHGPMPSLGDRHDRNGNGVVCRKVDSDGQFTGGPDDDMDDII